MRFILTLLIASLTPPFAFACSCVEDPPPKEALERATGVFVGKVTRREVLVPFSTVRFTFEVEEAIKGEVGKRITVETGYGGGDCGWEFQVGKPYLVYAYGTLHRLSTNICTRTKVMDDEGEVELAILRQASQEGERRSNQPVQHNAGSRPTSDDYSASETPSLLGPRG